MKTFDALRRLHARWFRYRHAMHIYAALRQLDSRTLHDIGLDRSEIGSVASEVAGLAERQRITALRTSY